GIRDRTVTGVQTCALPISRELSGNQTMIPFAGSDFWVADLGLEFLDWPRQRAVQREMRKFKSCVMLESVNPNPAPGGYTRVESRSEERRVGKGWRSRRAAE